jgi:hypothetical protein
VKYANGRGRGGESGGGALLFACNAPLAMPR